MPEKPPAGTAKKLNAKLVMASALAEAVDVNPELSNWLETLDENSGESRGNPISVPQTNDPETEKLMLSLIKSVGTGASQPTWFEWQGILANYFTGNINIVEPNLDVTNMTPEEREANEELLRRADTLRRQFEYTVKPKLQPSA
ncbi:MAG: hypothetical protein JNK26_01870 [Candidatus Doudnabacteria bacterium]|nr:hypothetical protein [Candidatus Doudnabacteria bacterium]